MKCSHRDLMKTGMTIPQICYKVDVEGVCDEQQPLINFVSLFFCEFEGDYLTFVPFVLLMLFVVFKYISITVEEYIAEGIAYLAEVWELSDSTAAVTLLAFANGAADMITVLVSSETEGGISYNIGALYGAGLFISSAVIGLCILGAKKKLRLNKMIIHRLVVFYILACLLTIGFASYKYITWQGSVLLLVVYILMVVVVMYDRAKGELSHFPNISDQHNTDRIHDSHKDSSIGEEDIAKARVPSQENSKLQDLHKKVISKSPKGKVEKLKGDSDDENHPVIKIDLPTPMARPASEIVRLRKTKDYRDYDRQSNFYEPRSLTEELRVKVVYNREKRYKPVIFKSGWELFVHFIEAPFMMVLYLTVLPCDREQYSKKRCLIYPIPGMLFATWAVMQEFSYRVLFIGLALGMLLLILFVLTLEEEPPAWEVPMYIMGMVGGLMWTYILVNLLIDLLESTKIIFNLNKTFMGLTILAIGSSMPDAVTTITLCKNSESIMAISGAYSGQLFALTIAFGIAMLKLTLKEGPQPFDLFNPDKLEENGLNLIVIFTGLAVLIVTLIYCSLTGFTMSKKFGWFLLSVYALFTTTATIFGVKEAIKTF